MRTWLKVLAAAIALVVLLVAAASWLVPGVLYRAAMSLERRAAGLQLRTVTVGDQRWALLEGKPEGAEALVLLHGFGADKDNWVRVARFLEGEFHLIVPDLPGFGDSPPAAGGDYSIEAQARAVGALIDALGIHEFSLGGSSMGGYIALALARQRPGQVKTLWLLAPGGISGAPLSDMMVAIASGEGNPLIPETAAGFERTLEFVFEQPPFIPLPVRRYLAARQAAGRELYETIFSDLRYRSAPAEQLADGLGLPALIVWGSEDRVLHPAGAELLAAIMPRAQVRIMDGIGHLPMIEDPARTAAEFLAWSRQQGP